MIGTWTPPGAIFTVVFDDERLTLELVKKTEIAHEESISWMTFDRSDTNTRAIFILAAKKPPYSVYGNPFYNHAGYLNVFSTNESGGMEKNIQNIELVPEAGIHGMVFDPTEDYLYSADMGANCVWCHKKDKKTGELELVGKTEAPGLKDHPRWVEMHASGKYLYVLMEAGNRLAVYVIDERTHMPVFTHHTYPLIPPGSIPSATPRVDPTKKYRADVVFLSHSKKYLFATARSNHNDVTGYISAFALNESGSIARHICMNPTPTSGGHSNAVSPCDFSDEWLALTDDQEGF
ncbi:hypothetical protein LTR28_001972, partial [Elasticomyces elasticus]